MYICLELATFICANCASVHRSHKRTVKGIGLSDFTDDIVKKVEDIGNAVCTLIILILLIILKLIICSFHFAHFIGSS